MLIAKKQAQRRCQVTVFKVSLAVALVVLITEIVLAASKSVEELNVYASDAIYIPPGA